MVKGEVAGRENVLVRVHSECFTGNVLGSTRCDCGKQLELARTTNRRYANLGPSGVVTQQEVDQYQAQFDAQQSNVLAAQAAYASAMANVHRFEDLKGSEQVLLHAEKDLTTKVEHDASHWVGHDETTTVDHDRTEHVKGDEAITIDNLATPPHITARLGLDPAAPQDGV